MVIVIISYLDPHLFEVLHSQRREVLQPVVGVSKLDDILVVQPQRPHDVPLEGGAPRFGHCFTLKDRRDEIRA